MARAPHTASAAHSIKKAIISNSYQINSSQCHYRGLGELCQELSACCISATHLSHSQYRIARIATFNFDMSDRVVFSRSCLSCNCFCSNCKFVIVALHHQKQHYTILGEHCQVQCGVVIVLLHLVACSAKITTYRTPRF